MPIRLQLGFTRPSTMLMPRCTSQLAHSDANAPCGNERARRLSAVLQYGAPTRPMPTNNETHLRREQPERAHSPPSLLPSHAAARLRPAHQTPPWLTTAPLPSPPIRHHRHYPHRRVSAPSASSSSSSSSLNAHRRRYGPGQLLDQRLHQRVGRRAVQVCRVDSQWTCLATVRINGTIFQYKRHEK